MSAHTPGPWKTSQGYVVSKYTHPMHEGQTRYGITYTPSDQRLPDIAIAEVFSEANAAFIVRACNAHEETLEALKAVYGFYEDPLCCSEELQAVLRQVRDALAKAEGRA